MLHSPRESTSLYRLNSKRLSGTELGMSSFSGINVTDNFDIVVSPLSQWYRTCSSRSCSRHAEHYRQRLRFTLDSPAHIECLSPFVGQRIFEVDGEGSATTIQTAMIEGNVGSAAYQILLVTDGGVASLLNSTIRFNNPVEVRSVNLRYLWVVLGWAVRIRKVLTD
jgi:hypothetical protein